MITLSDIRTYFISASLITESDIYIGKTDMTKEEVIGLYSESTVDNTLSIGGLAQTTQENREFTVFIHWNGSLVESEAKAIEIYEHFRANTTGFQIGSKEIVDIECTTGQPVYIDTDENNIHELILDFSISYSRI